MQVLPISALLEVCMRQPKTRTLAVLLSLLVTASISRVSAQSEGNTTVNCEAGGVDLQTKISHAAIGATIWITGTCAQGPYVVSKDISLRGFGANGATLSSPNGTHVLVVTGAVAHVEGVRIQGGAGVGIVVHGGSLFANDIVVEGATGDGIRLGVNSHGTITNSTFRSNSFGINATESSAGIFQGNLFEANAVAGLAVQLSGSAIVERNTIRDNSVVGMIVESNASVLLLNNTMSCHPVGLLVRRNGFVDTVNPANTFSSNGTDVQCFERGIIDAVDGPQQPPAGTLATDASCLIIGSVF